MDPISLILIALGLSMDAFAVSVASGITVRPLRVRDALLIGLFFGGFQALMPTVGWLAGLSLKDEIRAYDHWVAFGLLCFIGGKMIYESFFFDEAEREVCPLNLVVLLGLAIATSIDALAVGVTFAFLNISILAPVVVIGAITLVLSVAGVYIGRRFGSISEKKIEALGGLILIGIGTKILVEHVYLGG